MAVRMRKHESRHGAIRLLALVCAFSFAPPSSAVGAASADPCEQPTFGSIDLFNSFRSPLCKDLKDAGKMSCTSPKYSAALKGSCIEKCKASVDKWMKELPEVAAAASTADKGLAGDGILAGAGSTKETNAGLQAFRGQQLNASARGAAQTKRGENADKIKTKFDECRDDVNKSCKQNLASEDHKVATAVVKACDDAAKGAGKFADQKKQDGLGMGDLSKMMDMASKAMGMIPQNKSDTPSDLAGQAGGATSPTPTTATVPETQVTKLSGNSTAAPSVGFGGKPDGQQVALNTAGPSGSGLSGASSSNEDGFGSGAGSTGAGDSGAPSSGASGGSGGGAGGSGGSSGSSRVPAGALEASNAASSGYEMSLGGGGKAFGGLKASKSDLDAVADGSLLGELAAGDLGAASEPAAEENSGQGDSGIDDSDSIFARVRNKYDSLKGSGRF